MKKTLLVTAALALFLLAAVKTTHADYGCSGQYGQYGGCPPTQSIMIDKTVGKVVTNGANSTTIGYVDNLSASDPRFKAGDIVYFQLKVKNTSTATENNVKVTDYVPSYIDPVEGPGNFDSASRTIVFSIPQLNVDEVKTYTVKTQVVAQAKLNAIQALTCVTNKASAAVNSAYDEDTAQFCVEKQVVGVTQVPSTGPEHGIAVVVASLTSFGIGIFLKKKYN